MDGWRRAGLVEVVRLPHASIIVLCVDGWSLDTRRWPSAGCSLVQWEWLLELLLLWLVGWLLLLWLLLLSRLVHDLWLAVLLLLLQRVLWVLVLLLLLPRVLLLVWPTLCILELPLLVLRRLMLRLVVRRVAPPL